MSDQFVLWAGDVIPAQRTSFWIKNLEAFGTFEHTPFAHYEIIPDGNKTVVKWSVTLDTIEEWGAAESPSEAKEKILEALAKGGVDLRALPHYSLSRLGGMFAEAGRYILQQFDLEKWASLPDKTWIISAEKDGIIKRVSVYCVDDGTIESFPYNEEEWGSRTHLDGVKFTRWYLSRLHPELLGTEEVAAKLGWDKQRVSLYWRTKRFAFPDLFVGGRPSWNEKKGRWEGGGRPFWRPETVEPWTRNPGV